MNELDEARQILAQIAADNEHTNECSEDDPHPDFCLVCQIEDFFKRYPE